MHKPDLAILATLLVAASVPFPAGASDPHEKRLEQLERTLGQERERLQRLARESEHQSRELEVLRSRAVTIAAALRASEESLTALSSGWTSSRPTRIARSRASRSVASSWAVSSPSLAA